MLYEQASAQDFTVVYTYVIGGSIRHHFILRCDWAGCSFLCSIRIKLGARHACLWIHMTYHSGSDMFDRQIRVSHCSEKVQEPVHLLKKFKSSADGN